ncbi:uncharacterized protein KIAA0825 homolog isoform X2 [Ornithorhynchus anatinus]|uniref:uncharacterized protein KIAA0825 homolog isoform X2 n=1 Tax=Ornithorhynchus anatinus TaxID=9258 RepID=UPI0010A93CC8|nr:uncharacterized protein KIAA0825 homolog isoform X2 [Ornithorhynchus anatinus]
MDWRDEYSLSSLNLDHLLSSLPGELEFERIVSEIDEKLEKNATSIQQCLQEFQAEVKKICPDVVLQSASDCLQWLDNFNSKPVPTAQSDLIKFLKTVQNILKNEQNQEEMILDILLDISSQCGVSFPRTPSGTSFQLTSRTSLHAVEDDLSMDIMSMWDDIRLYLRRFLVNRLQRRPQADNLEQKISFKTQCIQQLLFLYPESEVLAKYQSMQNKLIVEILQECGVCYSSEINLDKLVHDCQSSIPRLCTMIKEDFYILCNIIEPSSTLKFINETYLDTIKEEMAVLLERLCELQFKDAKTSRHSNKHKGSMQAVGFLSILSQKSGGQKKRQSQDQKEDKATQKCPRKERNFCLSLYALRILSQFIKPLLKLEKEVEELFADMLLPSFTEKSNQASEYPHELGEERYYFSSCTGVQKKATEELLIEETAAKQCSMLPKAQEKKFTLLDFDWRSAFKELSLSVARCITIEIEDFSTKILQREQNEKSSAVSYAINLVKIQEVSGFSKANPEEEQPKQIAKFCSDIMEELDTILPLALAGRDDSLQEIRANFVEACCKVATAVLERLEERSKELPCRAPLQNSYALLSSAIYVCQRFRRYESSMEEIKEPLFLGPVQRYQEFISTLQFQVTDYCDRVCATSILQDGESHRWDDYKAFYEGERCSFSIQMWHYFCCALHHDLWTLLPPKKAQEILIEVLEKSLELLACRYAQANPSYERTPQIRFDVTAILICTESMLWSVCSSSRQLLNPNEDTDDDIIKIHTHCNNLFTTLVILTSPLTKLYETFQNGFDDHASDLCIQEPLHWVSSIAHFFPSLLRTPSAGKMAVEGHLKLLLSQPCCNWNLLLETLLQRDCLLMKILLRSSTTVSKSEEQISCEEPSLTEAIFKVLCYCSFSPKSLGSVLMNYMEHEQLWDFLQNMPATSCKEPEPEVIRCLKLLLIDSVKDIAKQIISLMDSCKATGNYGMYQQMQRLPESLLEAIPKEWDYVPKEMAKESKKGFTRLAAHAASIVISKLPTVIACLPPPIKYFFFLSERKMSKNFVELKKAGLLVWSLIVIICRMFEDGNTVELLTGATLDGWSKEKLSLVCECLESIIGMQQNAPKPAIQKVIERIEQQGPNWVESQLLKARQLSTECAFMTAEEGAVLEEESVAFELTEQKISMMVLDICHKPGGSEYLRQIYHIIRLNEDYLKEQLVSESVSEENTAPIRPLKVALTSMEEKPFVFNPFQVHRLFKENILDESSTSKWDWDWSNLLPSYLGLNKMTFRVLLENRWEMKEDETLGKEEKAMMEHLRKVCSTPSPLAPDDIPGE